MARNIAFIEGYILQVCHAEDRVALLIREGGHQYSVLQYKEGVLLGHSEPSESYDQQETIVEQYMTMGVKSLQEKREMVPDEYSEQLKEIRDIGVTNMLSFYGVQAAADQLEFYKLATWMAELGHGKWGSAIMNWHPPDEPDEDHQGVRK